MNRIPIESASIESFNVTIRTTADPTGDPIEFVATPATATSPTGTWQAGTWGTYANGRVTATTPTLGATGATLELAEGTSYTLWCRIGGAGGTVLRAALVPVT